MNPYTVVGGPVVPVNKLTLLAPYIAFASVLGVAIVLTVVYLKQVKRGKTKDS